jgi:hypothetical protein
MENSQKKLSFQLLTVITTPKLAEKTAEMFKKGALPLQYRFSAEGTASSDIMDMLGLGSIDKCVLVSMVPKHLSGIILGKLHSELQLDSVNSGIAFTIPLNGANNLILRMLTRNTEENVYSSDGKDENSMTESKHVLVAAIVNRGFSGDVMEAAKSAGAKGGTVINSRRIGNEEATGFWGLSVQEEKEIVMILTPVEDKLNIMRNISEKCGMNSDAKGIVMSMPIDSVMGI